MVAVVEISDDPIRGIGIDLVDIREIEEIVNNPEMGHAFLQRTYTTAERKVASQRTGKRRVAYLASRFAAKEAVFKAIASCLPEGDRGFDMRCVETLNMESGAPYVHTPPQVKGAMNRAGISQLHISLSDSSSHAIAIAIAV